MEMKYTLLKKDPIFNVSFRDFTAGTEQEAILNMFNVCNARLLNSICKCSTA